MRAAVLLALMLLVPASAQLTSDSARILAPTDVAGTLALPQATWYNDRDGDKVFDSLEQRYLAHAEQPVIVTFVAGTDVARAMDSVAAVADVAPRYVYQHFGGFAADMRLDEALAVASLPMVRQVEWSQPGVPELDSAKQYMNVDAVHELGFDGDLDGMGISGNDTLIAILDSGFDGQHVDLKGKFVRFIDWSDDGKEKEPYDSGNHGTHVASIAGGLGKGDPRYRGVAPGAGFVGFLIASGDTKGAAIASIDYLLEHRDELPVDALTISYGFGITVDGTDALELAMDKAWEAGITNFKSTGNSGPNRGTVTIPGGARGILGTASMYDPGEGGFRLSSFSSRGPTDDGRLKPDLAAPGSNIEAASAGSGDGYVSLSGTSMASPFAAGVAALVKSVDPSLSPDDVRRIMTSTAMDWGPPGHDIDYGHGRIDALRAVQLAALEKAVRDGLGAPWLTKFNVTGADLPGHAHGVLSGSAATFEVEDVGQPLSLTVIANHSIDSPVPAAPAPLNGFLAVVRDPSGLVIASLQPGGLGDVPSFGLSADPSPARQQTIAVMPTTAGTYSIEVLSGAHDEILWDVSAGLPPVELDAILGSAGSAREMADAPATSTDRAAPGLGLGVLVLAGLALLRRR